VVDDFAKPLQTAVRQHATVYIERSPSGVLAKPSLAARMCASVLGVILFVITTPLLLLGPVLFLVGMAKSRAHLGHWMCGYVVVKKETGEPVGFLGIFLRLAMQYLLPIGIGAVTAGLGGIVIMLIQIVCIAREGTHMFDLLLGQTVVFASSVKDKKSI